MLNRYVLRLRLKFPITWQRWQSHHSIRHSPKPHAACKIHGSMFYGIGVIVDRSFTLREWGFSSFCSCDLYIRTWQVFPWDIPDVQRWTSYVKSFRSYRLTYINTYIHTDRQTDRHAEFIYHAALQDQKYRSASRTHIQFRTYIYRGPHFVNHARIAPLVWNENRDKTWRCALLKSQSSCQHELSLPLLLSLSDVLVTRRFALVPWVQSLHRNVTSVTVRVHRLSQQCKAYHCSQYDVAL